MFRKFAIALAVLAIAGTASAGNDARKTRDDDTSHKMIEGMGTKVKSTQQDLAGKSADIQAEADANNSTLAKIANNNSHPHAATASTIIRIGQNDQQIASSDKYKALVAAINRGDDVSKAVNDNLKVSKEDFDKACGQ